MLLALHAIAGRSIFKRPVTLWIYYARRSPPACDADKAAVLLHYQLIYSSGSLTSAVLLLIKLPSTTPVAQPQ
ncbi:hypothetical protein BDW66DRAFT_94520 [Aspergillus desertorum]